MMGDLLTLDPDSDGRTAWLAVHSAAGQPIKKVIWLREGFGATDVWQAALATGWVRQEGEQFRLAKDISGESLRDAIDAILAYFAAPGVPGPELLEVQSAVANYDGLQDLIAILPLHAYAWLDLLVREDLADEARQGRRIWRNSRVVLDLTRHCDLRVAELVARYASTAATAMPIGPMARSLPTRQPKASPAKTG